MPLTPSASNLWTRSRSLILTGVQEPDCVLRLPCCKENLPTIQAFQGRGPLLVTIERLAGKLADDLDSVKEAKA